MYQFTSWLPPQPTPYLAPNPGTQPPNQSTHTQQQTGPDATAEFYAALNDPSRWVIKQGVPVFKAHERVDPNTGKLIKVDLSKLHRIANNMQQLERGGVPIRMTLGHTEPGKPEHQQPPVSGYYRNPRVQPFGPKGEPAVVVDEWLDPQYAHQRKNFPYRSAEYYDDAEQITGVALLTRDPYLDLGVVAYSRGERPLYCSVDGGLIAHTSPMPRPLSYALNPATGRPPVMYRLTLGELPMFPQGNQPPTPQYPQPQPQPQFAQVPPGYAAPAPGPIPSPYAQPPAAYVPAPTAYNAPQPPAGYSVPWPQPTPPAPYSLPASMRRPHVRNQWLYGRNNGTPYAGEPGMGGGGNPLQGLYECLTQAVQELQMLMEGSTEAPQAPFPAGGADGNPMTPASRYAQGHHGGRGDLDRRHFESGIRGMNRQQNRDMRADGVPHRLAPTRNPDGERGYARYDRGQEPMRTISGQPVGYQLKLDQMNYQLTQANQAIQMLMYERDQSDTQECLAEIRRLAAQGYAVGDQEFHELKNRPRDQRPAYLENIMVKYQKVPTEQLPPLLGDPTPGQNPAADPNRPIAKEEMEQALKFAASHPEDPNAYTNALNYMRNPQSQQQPTQYNNPALAGIAPFQRSFPPPEAAGAFNGDVPAGYLNPYPDLG